MITAKTCPVCGSNELQWVYYAPPEKSCPDLWEFDEDGYNPTILLKRIECKDCGASVGGLSLTCDEAIAYWNDTNSLNARYVMQKIGTEKVRNVEPPKEDET